MTEKKTKAAPAKKAAVSKTSKAKPEAKTSVAKPAAKATLKPTGYVSQVTGAVVDVKFENVEKLPNI